MNSKIVEVARGEVGGELAGPRLRMDALGLNKPPAAAKRSPEYMYYLYMVVIGSHWRPLTGISKK
jgi:hypothetical protein